MVRGCCRASRLLLVVPVVFGDVRRLPVRP
jgi:hypothetical protein